MNPNDCAHEGVEHPDDVPVEVDGQRCSCGVIFWRTPESTYVPDVPNIVTAGFGKMRRAVALMRQRAAASQEPAFVLAAADWLEADAGVLERHDLDPTISKAYAAAVAYLGASS